MVRVVIIEIIYLLVLINKQLLDEIFAICRIINVEVRVTRWAEGEADNSYRDIVNLIESHIKHEILKKKFLGRWLFYHSIPIEE